MSRMRVVVGVDGSEPAADALAWAAEVAAASGAALEVVVVADPRHPVGEPAESIIDRALVALPRALARDTSALARSGDLALELAAASDGDLLVIGTHKTGFLRGRVLGSRSLRIAGATAGPIAIIPAGSLEARIGVVAGIETGQSTDAVVLTAAEHARRLGEELVIVHSLGRLGEGERTIGGETVDPARVRAAAAAHLVAERVPGLAVRIRISRRASAEAFLDASRTARLLVVGAADDDRRAAFAGSTVHDVVLNVNAPLLVVPVTAAAGDPVAAAAVPAPTTMHG